MTLTLDLSAQAEAWISAQAEKQGIPAEDIALRMLEQQVKVATSADSETRVRALLAQWQAIDQAPFILPQPASNGESPIAELFEKWAEEDAAMTEEEKDAEDRLWEDILEGMNETRAAAGMRLL